MNVEVFVDKLEGLDGADKLQAIGEQLDMAKDDCTAALVRVARSARGDPGDIRRSPRPTRRGTLRMYRLSSRVHGTMRPMSGSRRPSAPNVARIQWN